MTHIIIFNMHLVV